MYKIRDLEFMCMGENINEDLGDRLDYLPAKWVKMCLQSVMKLSDAAY